ncbi:MAG: relaxase/mobilization nuclease domain-containing protein [Hyphomicrobium sp.]|jgi:hypothetical protein|uniref:relaxase/mobilization nuclease domain-containing protein n=1 Tax=Hyphomicrobium sp. TaxID=82 RepID=UPI0025C4F5BD|nr:relaxase/mobilization nuclease domain-containing protein [Hyphomicrobium sp.]MBX9865149.1 relaxase/mobilization nuclease domain-containing protein [Hyphomicrobium sp.]
MVPKLIRGSSFKGAAGYLLQDIGADTRARVAWTEVRNLASSSPQTAWRVMAATAMDAERLKENAGIKATGRKSAQSVLHLVLSWHPEEAEHLDREQMLAAAEGALKAIGASDRQALIIAHSDSAHPHIHLLINRVSPRDGRMLSSSKEKLKLSKWAQRYEEERGKIYCEDRVLNNEARERGEFTRAAKGIPWQIMKAERLAREAANDNPDKTQQIREKLRARMVVVGRSMRSTINRHRREWQALEDGFRVQRREIAQSFAKARVRARELIVQEFRPLWRDNRRREQEDLARLAQDERSLLGRARSVLRTIGHWRSILEGDRIQGASLIWNSMFSAEARKQILQEEHAMRRAAMQNRQRQAIRREVLPIHAEHRLRLHSAAKLFIAERSSLVLGHSADRAKLRAQWSALRQERAEAYAQLRASHEHRETFKQAASAESYFEKLKAMARAEREKTAEQSNTRGRDRGRERD